MVATDNILANRMCKRHETAKSDDINVVVRLFVMLRKVSNNFELLQVVGQDNKCFTNFTRKEL